MLTGRLIGGGGGGGRGGQYWGRVWQEGIKTPRRYRMNAERSYQAGQPGTFSNQDKLPRLPVPPLQSTLSKYLQSLVPFIQQEALKEKADDDYVQVELRKRQELIDDFKRPGGLGERLQNRLIDLERSQDSPCNWLDDSLWRSKAYGEWRAPLVVNSNWQLSFRDDPSTPEHLLPKEYNTAFVNITSSPSRSIFSLAEDSRTDTQAGGQGLISNAVQTLTGGAPAFSPVNKIFSTNKGAAYPSGHTAFQLKRAAHLASRLLSFKSRLDREEILPDASRAGPFDMHQYTQVFGVTRIPSHGCDKLVRNKGPGMAGRHISVLVGGRVWELEVMGQDGTVATAGEMEGALAKIVEQAQETWSTPPDDVGVLTADHRDSWTLARENLLQISDQNRQILDSLETSLFLLALDHYASGDGKDLSAHLRNVLCGASAHNRWFDKAISIVVESNGRAGVNGEHSPCDALIPSIIIDYVLAEDVDISTEPVDPDRWSVKALAWQTDESTKRDIQSALERIRPIIEDSDPYILYYSDYGVDFVKKVARQPPDAYMQMALQLAFYKMHGKGVATYETASTRAFMHGRTDVIRSFSKEAFAFVRAMVDPATSPRHRFALLSAATKSHADQTKVSSSGHGIDRHLLVLRLLLQPGESHPLFSDPLFSESQRWTLSTSGLSAGDRFNGTNFGAAYPDGYGINYLAGAHLLKFGIESKRSNAETDTIAFARKVAEALNEMKAVVMQGVQGSTTAEAQAKL